LGGKTILISQNHNNIRYIQQKDEFDYLKNFIKSIEKGTCMGILLHGPPGTVMGFYPKFREEMENNPKKKFYGLWSVEDLIEYYTTNPPTRKIFEILLIHLKLMILLKG